MGEFSSFMLVHLTKKGPLNTPKDTKNLEKNKRVNGQDPLWPHSQDRRATTTFVWCLPRRSLGEGGCFVGKHDLSFFLRQLHGQIDRGDHAIGARDTFACDIECGAV